MIDFLTEYEATDRYIDFLDENYGTVQICGGTYSASHALRMIDPIAFRIGLSDFIGALVMDGYEVEGYNEESY